MYFTALLAIAPALASLVSGATIFPRVTKSDPNSLALRAQNTDLCIGVDGELVSDGSLVSVYNCRQPRCNYAGCQYAIYENTTLALIPFVSTGDLKFQVNNTNFCLDAGSDPSNGVQLKTWTCYDDLPAQAFYRTGDAHVALTGSGLCLDIKDQIIADNTPLQLWQCSGTASNQLFEPVPVSSLIKSST